MSTSAPSTSGSKFKRSVLVNYVNQVGQGMKAKKYRGGEAAKTAKGSKRVFDAYFKPLT